MISVKQIDRFVSNITLECHSGGKNLLNHGGAADPPEQRLVIHMVIADNDQPILLPQQHCELVDFVLPVPVEHGLEVRLVVQVLSVNLQLALWRILKPGALLLLNVHFVRDHLISLQHFQQALPLTHLIVQTCVSFK